MLDYIVILINIDMATSELLGYRDIIKHENGTYFDRTFEVVTEDLDTLVETDFPLTGYNWTFVIYNKIDGVALFTASSGSADLTISTNTYRLKKKIDLEKTGRLYFEFKGVNTSDATKIYRAHYGDFFNER